MALSAWSDAELRTLFATLRVDQPLSMLAQLTPQALSRHLDLLSDVLDAARSHLDAREYPSAELVPGMVRKMAEGLASLPPSKALAAAKARLEALRPKR